MGVVTTSEVGEDEIFGPIPMTMTLADPAVLIGHRTCDTPPDIHSVKVSLCQFPDQTNSGIPGSMPDLKLIPD